MRLFIFTETLLQANTYVWANTETNEAVVVDPGAGSADWVKNKVQAEGLRIVGVLLTHGHPDHVWDAAAVAGDAPVFISSEDMHRLDDPMAHVPFKDAWNADPWVKPENISAIPGEALVGSGTQILPGFPVRAVPVPGHTEGSVGYLTAGVLEPGEDAITIDAEGCGGGCDGCDCGASESDPDVALFFLGDVILGDSIGRTDLPGGDMEEMRSTLKMLAVSINPDTVIATGHGPLSTLGYQLQANDFLRQAALG